MRRPPSPVSRIWICVGLGIVTALANGDDFPEAIRAGVAAGTVNALYAGGAQFTFEHYQEILRQTSLDIL